MNIPTYVYVLFASLVYIGIKRCFTRIIKVRRLFMTPIFFLFFSIKGMYDLFDLRLINLSIWLTGCLIGIFSGYRQVKNKSIKADRRQQLIETPGDLSMLLLILAAFFSEFFIHYVVESGVLLGATSTFKLISLIILGLFAGLSVGRALNYFRKYRVSPDMTLAI